MTNLETETPDLPSRKELRNDFSSARDFVLGEVIGTRGWNIDELGRLRGVTHRTVMKPGENVARCRTQIRSNSPHAGKILDSHDMSSCSCGFYAYFDDAGAPGDYGQIQGIIRAYGKTTIGEKGFRAEKAQVIALALTQSPPEPRRSTPKKSNLSNRLIKRINFIYPTESFLNSERNSAIALLGTGFVFSIVAVLFLFIAGIGNMMGEMSIPPAVFYACIGIIAYFVPLFLSGDEVLRPGKTDSSSREKKLDVSLIEQREKLQLLYPDVKIYDTTAEMFKNHKLSSVSDFVYEPPAPTPSDPDFWERDL